MGVTGQIFANKFKNKKYFVKNDKYSILVVCSKCCIYITVEKNDITVPDNTTIPMYVFKYIDLNKEREKYESSGKLKKISKEELESNYAIKICHNDGIDYFENVESAVLHILSECNEL